MCSCSRPLIVATDTQIYRYKDSCGNCAALPSTGYIYRTLLQLICSDIDCGQWSHLWVGLHGLPHQGETGSGLRVHSYFVDFVDIFHKLSGEIQDAKQPINGDSIVFRFMFLVLLQKKLVYFCFKMFFLGALKKLLFNQVNNSIITRTINLARHTCPSDTTFQIQMQIQIPIQIQIH